MKKILMILACAILLASCNKDKEIELSYQLTANIDVLDVVNDLKDCMTNEQLFPNGTIPYNTSAVVRISFFVYDANGNLVSEKYQTTNSFANVVSFTNFLNNGEYSIVTCADIQTDHDYWTFENKAVLKDFKIVDKTYDNTLYKVLGVNKVAVEVDKSKAIAIKVKPVGAMIQLNFDYLSTAAIETIKLTINKFNDFYSVNTAYVNIKDILNGDFDDRFERDPSYKNFIAIKYYLPVSQINFPWSGYNAAGTLMKSGTTPSFAIKAGENKFVNINTNTGGTTITVNSYTQMSVPYYLNNSPVLHVASLPSDPLFEKKHTK